MLLLAKKLCGTVCKLRAGSPVSPATDVTVSRESQRTQWGNSHGAEYGAQLVFAAVRMYRNKSATAVRMYETGRCVAPDSLLLSGCR